MENETQLFIVLGKAVAAQGHRLYPAGQRNAVLAYTMATSRNEAEAIAMRELDKEHWVYFEATQIGIVDPANIDLLIAHNVSTSGFYMTVYSGIEV